MPRWYFIVWFSFVLLHIQFCVSAISSFYLFPSYLRKTVKQCSHFKDFVPRLEFLALSRDLWNLGIFKDLRKSMTMCKMNDLFCKACLVLFLTLIMALLFCIITFCNLVLQSASRFRDFFFCGFLELYF